TPRRRAAASPLAPTTNGEARCTTSGPNPASAVSTVRVGTPTGRVFTTGRSTDGTRTTGAPRYSSGPAPGATTSTSSPRAVRCSTTRSTELVTPFTCGRKLSVTMATRTSQSVRPAGGDGATHT